jgi:hypothetical protein
MRIWLGAVLLVAVLSTSCQATDQGFRTIEGRVYARLDDVRGPVDPVAGAAVSNNWDQTTATTDQNGRFVIRVKRVAADEFMILRVELAGRAACRRLAGTATGPILDIFLDGSPFGSQRCESS